MKIVAVDNTNSAQPSAGPQSPRIFVIRYPLLLSIVPAGQAKNLLELSQVEQADTSVKAEIEFPVTQNIDPAAPYSRLIVGPGLTGCIACHSGEYKVLYGYNGEAYANSIIRPDSLKVVSPVTLRNYALACDPKTDGYRCGILNAIFISGQATQGIFP
jgi:hypothetical protein